MLLLFSAFMLSLSYATGQNNNLYYKMSLIRTLVFLLIAGKVIFAQQIFFCKSVGADGKPVEHKTNWDMKSGSPVTILFDGNKPFNSSVVYLFIDRMVAGNYEAYDSKAVSTEKTGKQLSYVYYFTESGNYSIYLINNSGERLVQGNVIIRISEKPAPPKEPQVTPEEKNIFSAEILFCEKVTANKPVNIKESVSLKAGGDIVVYIRSSEAFNTNSLTIHIYRKKGNSIEDLLQTKKFKTGPAWQNIYFKYKFDSPGEYRFAVYDEVENIIKSSSIFVTQ